jgi:hypothetical protein
MSMSRKGRWPFDSVPIVKWILTDINEMVKEFISSSGPWGRIMNVIHVTEPTCRLVGHPTECHFLKVFHEEDGNDR